MDEHPTHIRIWYRRFDVIIVTQRHQQQQWQQQRIYTHHQTWLQQVYRTLIEADQFDACMHEIDADVPPVIWQPICDATLSICATLPTFAWMHLVCVDADGQTHGQTEDWVRQKAICYATNGLRINGIKSPANNDYVNYLLHRDAQFLSGAYFDHDGTLIRNGAIVSERILAKYWYTQRQCQNELPMS